MIRWLIVIGAMVAVFEHPRPVGFFEVFALLGLWALLEIADELTKLRKAQTLAEPLDCDDEIDGIAGGVSLWCARRLGHRGPHSTSRHPHAGSTTWRKAAR